MRTLYGDTYMNEEELREIGINYPIKLEYFKMYNETGTNKKEYEIEIVKSSYIGEVVNIEKRIVKNLYENDKVINKILSVLKKNEVTPIVAKDVIEDMLKFVK